MFGLVPEKIKIVRVAIFGNLLRIWLLLTPICYKNFLLATWSFWLFFGYFWKFGKKLVLNQFKTGFGSISLCLDVDIFAFWKSFDVDILGFQKCFDVGLLGFSKIWLLFAQTFWQHWWYWSLKFCKNLGISLSEHCEWGPWHPKFWCYSFLTFWRSDPALKILKLYTNSWILEKNSNYVPINKFWNRSG